MARCLGNPRTASLIQRYPVLKEDNEPIRLRSFTSSFCFKQVVHINSELYEAQRWHCESNLWTPMMTLHGQHIFIGDIVDVAKLKCSGKVVKFFEVKFNNSI